MLLFKKIDLAGQVCLIVYGIVKALVIRDFISIIDAYFLVGGWQVLSFFTHVFLSKHYYPLKQRDYYGYTLLCLLIFGIIISIIGGIFVFLVMLLFISPILAIWYATICDLEIKRLRNKALIHLK